jgi:hypothetical protein
MDPFASLATAEFAARRKDRLKEFFNASYIFVVPLNIDRCKQMFN